MESDRRVETVDELSLRLKGILEESALFSHLLVKGEVSGKKEHGSAVYFDLKGERSLLSCLIWNDVYRRQKEPLSDGDEILVSGELSYYAARGRLSFKVHSYEKSGAGSEQKALRELYAKLKKEGLFDRPRKKLPPYPSRIAIVTGYRSAAEADLVKNISRRWPLAKIEIHSSLVQGDKAPSSLLRAVAKADAGDSELIVIARGGGSSDDLSAFNDEALVRRIATIEKPVVSAVGHEIDVSLVDLASDYRASTPSSAAELVTPDLEEVLLLLDEKERRLLLGARKKVSLLSSRVTAIASRPLFAGKQDPYLPLLSRLDGLALRLKKEAAVALQGQGARLVLLSEKLSLASPMNTLKRGYAYLVDKAGRNIVSARDAQPGTVFEAHVSDGIIEASVTGGHLDEGN